MMKYCQEIFESPFFVPEFNNWHLKSGAPESLKKKFKIYMENYDKIHEKENLVKKGVGKKNIIV